MKPDLQVHVRLATRDAVDYLRRLAAELRDAEASVPPPDWEEETTRLVRVEVLS